MFENSSVLITGGTGSFGNEVAKLFLSQDIGELRIFSRDEKKQEEMRQQYADDRLKFYIGDVRDQASVELAVRGVDYIFHAAALKQVPSCEFHPLEAVKTNILGASNVMSEAIRQKIKKVVVLSTDKAVYPINAMGQSKALMEKVMVASARNVAATTTTLCATRYGNVMASRGSVIPLFISQLKSNSPITITDPEMTRFLMSLEESVDLVLHAYSEGSNGDIFVRKAPASTIGTLFNALKEIFESDSEMQVIGVRHGEKMFESLVSKEEMLQAEESAKYYRISADNRDLNYSSFVSKGEPSMLAASDYTSHNTTRLSVKQTKELLLKLPYVQEQMKT